MDHSHMGGMDGMGGMSGTSTGTDVPSLFSFQHWYYAAVGAAVGVATVANVVNYILYRQRQDDRSIAQSLC